MEKKNNTENEAVNDESLSFKVWIVAGIAGAVVTFFVFGFFAILFNETVLKWLASACSGLIMAGIVRIVFQNGIGIILSITAFIAGVPFYIWALHYAEDKMYVYEIFDYVFSGMVIIPLWLIITLLLAASTIKDSD
ncbi:hypothetical protein [Anaerovibrio sp.]|uniref:hypothetical protein n=1 Tax=Anaerovibrio sp. TaxID=1872532 RepID=UPI003F14278A